MATCLSVRLSTILFVISLLLSAGLAYHAARTMTFAFPIAPDAMATLIWRVQAVRIAGLCLALILMLLVYFAASRAARGALALRWLLGIATSAAFLRSAGLINPLPDNDTAIVAISALQLALEALAILLLYGEDASDWFDDARG